MPERLLFSSFFFLPFYSLFLHEKIFDYRSLLFISANSFNLPSLVNWRGALCGFEALRTKLPSFGHNCAEEKCPQEFICLNSLLCDVCDLWTCSDLSHEETSWYSLYLKSFVVIKYSFSRSSNDISANVQLAIKRRSNCTNEFFSDAFESAEESSILSFIYWLSGDTCKTESNTFSKRNKNHHQ